MMDMSECPGVMSSTGKEFASESNNLSQSKKSWKTNAQKVLHGPNHSIQTYGQQAHPRLMPSSGQLGRKQVDLQKTHMLKRTQELINFPNQSSVIIPNKQQLQNTSNHAYYNVQHTSGAGLAASKRHSYQMPQQ
jgi:hypothetical protein